MYNEKLLFESQIIVEDIALANGAIDLSAYKGIRAAGAEGKLKITMRCNTDTNSAVILDKDATVTLTEMSLDLEPAAGTFVASVPSNARVIIASAADLTFVHKQEIMSMLVSKEASKYIRPTLALGGTFGDTDMNVDIFLEYVPS